MTIDFKAAKDRKDGNITPRVLRDSMDKWIDDYDNLDSMIVIYEHDGILEVARTSMYDTRVIGHLEVAKQMVLEEMRE
ncbi:MAG: hypothetical protein ACOCRO_08000 [Halanaerobiales bacterium]